MAEFWSNRGTLLDSNAVKYSNCGMAAKVEHTEIQLRSNGRYVQRCEKYPYVMTIKILRIMQHIK